jgi:photosystem II stability/assembly factor-like uncharacterized protein
MLKRLIRCGVMAATALLTLAGPASAGIWTPISSGTTAAITAIAYAGTTPVYGTASGQLLKGGVVKSTNPGYGVRDIAFAPGGAIGLAALSSGRLLRTVNAGETWSTVTTTTVNQTTVCASSPGGPSPTGPVTGNFNAVTWKDASTAYAISQQEGVVQKTTNGGAAWTEVSRQSNNTCRVDAGGAYGYLTDAYAVPGSDFLWMISSDFGSIYISPDGLATPVARLSDDGVNCYDHRPRLAVDPDQSNVAFQVDGCNGNLQLSSTQDAGATWSGSQNYFAGDGHALTGLNDVAVAGGSALAVGNGGAILVDPNGRDAYFQRADGADATGDWDAVAKLDAHNAVVGGAGGRLLVTTDAGAIPDIVAPDGAISGPSTVVAGVPATFTANLSDNAGGSGIDAGSLVWSASDLPNAGGNPVTLSWPTAGYKTVTVAFKDAAGNAATRSIGVSVSAPARTTMPPITRTPPAPNPIRTTSATAGGAKISLGTPNTCVAPGGTFKVTLTWQKQKRKGNRFVKVRRADFSIGTRRVKIDTKAPFTQTLKVTASTRKGSTITVKARAYIKVTHGRSPTKSIKTTVKVCG